MSAIAALITLPLSKVSYSQETDTSAEHASGWQHVTTPNLSFRIGILRLSTGDVQILTVLQADHVLAEVPLQEQIEQGMQMIEHHRRAGVELPKEKLPIAAITRAPVFFAFRYTLPSQKIRRMQCRFNSEGDFRIVLQHMEQLGLSMTEHVVPGSSALPVNKHQPRASSPLAKYSEVPSRPQTALTNDTRMAAPPRPSTARESSGYLSITEPSSKYTETDVGSSPSTLSSYSRFSENIGRHSDILSPPERWQRPAHLPTLPFISEHDAESSVRPLFLNEDVPISSTLPPRRELPFNRPSSSAGSDSVKSPQRTSGEFNAFRSNSPQTPTTDQASAPTLPLAQSLNLPTLPKPTLLERPAAPAPAIPSPTAHGPTGNYSSSQQVSPSTSEALQHASEDRLVSQLVNTGSGNRNENLTAYAVLPAQDRAAILDDWFANLIADKNFLTLVEDMETNITRIPRGLGS